MKTALCLILLLLLRLSTAVSASDNRTSALEYEPKLDKPVTITLRAATLKDVLAEVEKATGMHLLVDRSVAEDKATVWVKDQPAREVLRALAHCFNLGWSESPRTAEKPYLRLWADRDYQVHMSDRDYQDYVSIVGQYDKELKLTGEQLKANVPYEWNHELMAKLEKENVPEYHRLERRNIATTMQGTGAAVLQFLALSEDQRKQLFSGSHVVVSGAEMCADAKKRWPEATSFDYTTDRTVGGYMLRCAIRPGKEGGTNLLSSAYFDDQPYAKEADDAAKRMLADAELDKALSEGAKIAKDAELRPGEGSGAVPATMSDGLIELAKITNMPVVAQFVSEYRTATPVDSTKDRVDLMPSAAKKIGERIAELGKDHMFVVNREGQFLEARCLLWHRLRLREVPEATIKAWQKECWGLPFPTFNGFVMMAPLRWEQVRGTIDNERKYVGVETLIHLARCEYPLKIYASLNEDQRVWLQSGKELSVVTLTPQQQYYFMCGFEVREKPTFQAAKDRNWPSTASISMKNEGYNGLTVYARAGTKALGELPPDTSGFSIPENASKEECVKLVEAFKADVLAKGSKKLREQVAKEHPEIPVKDVTVYVRRNFVWTLKLGETERQCEMVYADPFGSTGNRQ